MILESHLSGKLFGRTEAQWFSCGDHALSSSLTLEPLSELIHHSCFVELVVYHFFQPRVHRRL